MISATFMPPIFMPPTFFMHLMHPSTILHWMAQVPLNTTSVPPEAASVLFTGPQFFIALISGILLAFAIQLVLTNLSVAAGISYLGRSSDSDDHHSSSGGTSLRKIGFGMGLWTLVSVTISLFFASYLAIQLSFLTTAGLGAIVGLVIWAAYFSLLVWVSSSTVGSLIGSVVNAANSGFQSILGAATAAIGSKMAQQQVVSTAEAVAAAVRNEMGAGIDPNSIRESVEGYVRGLRLPGLDTSQLRKDFEGLLNDPEIAALADGDRLRHIDRKTFVDLVSKRTDFSVADVNRIADLLEGVWKQTVGKRSRPDSMSELVSYLQSTQPGQLQVKELNAKLDQLLAERSNSGSPIAQDAKSSVAETLQSGVSTLVGLLAGRTDLSDLDLEKIVGRLKTSPSTIAQQGSKVVAQLKGSPSESSEYSPIRQDVEHYLLTKYSWQMTPDILNREFREVLYDPNADPSSVIQQLSQFKQADFTNLLASRGVFTQARIQEISDQLEAIRKDVLSGAETIKELEIADDLRQRIETYLTLTPKEQLYSNEVLPAFKALLLDDEANSETLASRLAIYDRATLHSYLNQRVDLITPAEVEPILNGLEATRDRVLFDAKSVDEQAKQKLTEYQQRLTSYLQNTGKSELNPEGIKRDVQLLLHDPQLGLDALRSRASHVDRDTLVQLLRQRDDISEAEANQILDQVESNWHAFISSPRMLVDTVKGKVDDTQSAIADYLRRTNREELNPEGIQRDLKKLLEHPKEGTVALRRRLSKIDRETLVQLLSQREDLSEEEVNRVIDQVQNGIRQVIRSPRRLALRTQQRVVDFESSVEDYLRNTNKDELNPDAIKRDLGLLIQSPKAGVQNLGDRFSRFDRSTIIALLSQREDMTPEEAERIVTQVESVRDQFIEQMRQVQHRVQLVVDRVFDRIRDYLNSLDRPELNYDSVKQDVRTLFDDPQAGFDALRTRLSHFDRNTLVALLSSRKDISESDANRIIDQIEGARNSVLQRAEMVQTEVQRRLEEVKQTTQRQIEDTRKAAEAAAWWLFMTALVSAIASAGAGALAAS